MIYCTSSVAQVLASIAYMAGSSDFFPELTKAFRSLDDKSKISTKEFADACASILPIFDYLGETLSSPLE